MINSFIFGELQDKEPYYTLGCITRTSEQKLFLCRPTNRERNASASIMFLLI